MAWPPDVGVGEGANRWRWRRREDDDWAGGGEGERNLFGRLAPRFGLGFPRPDILLSTRWNCRCRSAELLFEDSCKSAWMTRAWMSIRKLLSAE